MDAKERKEHEKWKKLEIRAKSKLAEKDRKKESEQELSELLKERRQIGDEWKHRKESAGKSLDEEIAKKIKELEDNIKKNEKSIEELNLKIAAKDEAIKSLESGIGKAEEEKKRPERILQIKSRRMERKV